MMVISHHMRYSFCRISAPPTWVHFFTDTSIWEISSAYRSTLWREEPPPRPFINLIIAHCLARYVLPFSACTQQFDAVTMKLQPSAAATATATSAPQKKRVFTRKSLRFLNSTLCHWISGEKCVHRRDVERMRSPAEIHRVSRLPKTTKCYATLLKNSALPLNSLKYGNKLSIDYMKIIA